MTTYVLLLDLSESLRILVDVSNSTANRNSIHLDKKHGFFFMFSVQTPNHRVYTFPVCTTIFKFYTLDSIPQFLMNPDAVVPEFSVPWRAKPLRNTKFRDQSRNWHCATLEMDPGH